MIERNSAKIVSIGLLYQKISPSIFEIEKLRGFSLHILAEGIKGFDLV
jgi:hypothetical protein